MSVSHELEDRLSAAGKRLLQPPSSLDELLTLLDRIEELLALVAQSPPTSMQSAMSPLLKALISEELLKHPDIDIRVGVAACISEITRITAPEAPYGDDEMKDVFQLIVSTFDNLADKSSRSYKKRASILETVAKVRSCVIMLDLELDQMIVEMFQHFLKSIRLHHEDVIFTSMSAIMTLVLEESEDISPEFLWPILDALKKNNKEVQPIAKKLAGRVIKNCADKLRPCLAKAVNTLNASLDDYNEVVASVCKKTNGSFGHSDENMLKDQPATEDVKEEIKPQEKDPAWNGTHKSIACNSVGETGDEETVTDVFPLMLNQQQKVAMHKLQYDAQSTTKTESDDIGAQKRAHLEVKSERTANGEVRPANCRNNSAESSDIIDDEKQEGEQVPLNQEIPSEEIHTFSREFPPVEAEKPLDTVQDTTSQGSPEKESEDEAVNIASPTQRSSLPDENQPKRAGRTKRKKNVVKEDTASRKVSEGPNIGEVTKKRRTMKKQHNLPNNVEKVLNEDVSKNDAGAMSDLEARCLDSGELGGASNKKKNKSLLKEDGKKGGRVKPKLEEETSKYSAGDDGNNTDASLSTAKSAEDEVNQEETPRVDSKRKRASGENNTPRTIKYGKNLVGSKVRVFWPDDDKFYEGEITLFDHLKKRHRVVYDDGEIEDLNLRKEKWEFLMGDSALDGGKSAEHSGQGASSKKKGKKGANSKTSNKHEKMSNPPRKSKGSASKSGSKSKKDGKVKLESPVNSEDGSDKSEDHSEEHEVKSPDSSAKSGRSQPSLKKRAIQRLANNSKGKPAQSGKNAGPVVKGTKKSSSSKVQEEKKSSSSKAQEMKKSSSSKVQEEKKSSSSKAQEMKKSSSSKGKEAVQEVKKSSSSKAKEAVQEEKVKSVDAVKGGKSQESGNRSGKKRKK